MRGPPLKSQKPGAEQFLRPCLGVQGSLEDPHIVFVIRYTAYGIEYMACGIYPWRSRVAMTRL